MPIPLHLPIQVWAGLPFLAYLVYLALRAQLRKPRIRRRDVVYQEWFASGHSDANFLTRGSDLNGCVRLIVTAEYLIVTSWFPFLMMSAFSDLEHVIRLETLEPIVIREVKSERYMVLTYRDREDFHHTILVLPRDRHAFLNAVGLREMAEA